MGALVENKTSVSVREYLMARKGGLDAALPKHVTADRLIRVACNAIARSPDLQACDAVSLCGAIIQAALLGLEINSPIGSAWLIPYGGKATLVIDYRGLIDIARRTSGMMVYAQEHRMNDKFFMQRGTDPKIDHNIDPTQDRGETVGFYAVYKMPNGDTDFEYMSKEQVEAARNQSACPNSLMWTKFYDQGGCKTAIKRLMKRAPKSPDSRMAIELDNDAEMGRGQDFSDAIDVVSTVTDANENDNKKGNNDNGNTNAPSDEPVETTAAGTVSGELPLDAGSPQPGF